MRVHLTILAALLGIVIVEVTAHVYMPARRAYTGLATSYRPMYASSRSLGGPVYRSSRYATGGRYGTFGGVFSSGYSGGRSFYGVGDRYRSSYRTRFNRGYRPDYLHSRSGMATRFGSRPYASSYGREFGIGSYSGPSYSRYSRYDMGGSGAYGSRMGGSGAYGSPYTARRFAAHRPRSVQSGYYYDDDDD